MNIRMRKSTLSPLALVALVALLAAGSSLLAAEESTWSKLWPFGGDQQSADESTLSTQEELLLGDPNIGTETAEGDGWMITSPFANVTWPEIKMPKLEFASPWQKDSGEDGWLAAPVHKVQAGARGAFDRTRMAWNNSIDRMKLALPGGNDPADTADTQLADADEQPGFFSRMLGRSPAEPADDRVEFMASEPGDIAR